VPQLFYVPVDECWCCAVVCDVQYHGGRCCYTDDGRLTHNEAVGVLECDLDCAGPREELPDADSCKVGRLGGGVQAQSVCVCVGGWGKGAVSCVVVCCRPAVGWTANRLHSLAAGAAAGGCRFCGRRGLVYCSMTLTVLDPRSVANCPMLIHAGWLLVCVGGGTQGRGSNTICVCVWGGCLVGCWAAARACTATLFPQEAARADGGAGPWGGWRDRRGLLV
jgi:hypothetical protein